MRNLPPEWEGEKVKQGDGQHQRLPLPEEESNERQHHVAQGEADADCQSREQDPNSTCQDLSTCERTQSHNTNRARQLPMPRTNSVFIVTQNKGRDIAGDASHTTDKEEGGEHGPSGGENLEQDGDRHERHGPKQDGFPSKPAGRKQ